MPWVVERAGPLRTVWPWYRPYPDTFLRQHEHDADMSEGRCYCCGRHEVLWHTVCGTCAYWYGRVKAERARRMRAAGRTPNTPRYPFAERFVSAMRKAYFNLDWVHDTWRYHSAIRRAQVAAAQEAAHPPAPAREPLAGEQTSNEAEASRGPLAGMIHA